MLADVLDESIHRLTPEKMQARTRQTSSRSSCEPLTDLLFCYSQQARLGKIDLAEIRGEYLDLTVRARNLIIYCILTTRAHAADATPSPVDRGRCRRACAICTACSTSTSRTTSS